MWGEPAHGACQRLWLARDVLRRGGNPPSPACPRRGKRERGRSKFLAAAGDFWSSLAILRVSRIMPFLAIERRLDPFAPQHLKVVHRLPPVLERVRVRLRP